MKNKKIVALLLASSMSLTVLAGCSNANTQSDVKNEEKSTEQTEVSKSDSANVAESNETKELEPVTLRIFMADKATPDDEKVEEYINNLPQVQKLNVTIDIVKQAGGSAEHNEKVPLLLATDEQMDIGFDNSANYAMRVSQGAYYDISEFLKNDPEFYEALPESLWKGSSYEGGIYGVPTCKEIAVQYAMYVDQEILDKYNIKADDITDYEDLEIVLDALQQEGDRSTIMAAAANWTNWFRAATFDDYDPFNGTYYANIDKDGKTLINPYETEEFAEFIQTMYEWNQKGYIGADTLTRSTADEEVKGGKKFGMTVTSYSPYAEIGTQTTYGVDKIAVLKVAGAPVVNSTSARGSVFGVYAKSKNPERAYEFLKLWNTDPEVKNAIYYGIPEVHYNLVDGKAEVVENKNELYYQSNWRTGNMLISYLAVGEPDDKWEVYDDFNASSREAADLGMLPNTDDVADEIATIGSVLTEYMPALVFGFVDPETGIAQLNEQLKAAGIDEVLAELQVQYDAFCASK